MRRYWLDAKDLERRVEYARIEFGCRERVWIELDADGWFEIGGRQEGHLRLNLELDAVESLHLELIWMCVDESKGLEICVEWMRLNWTPRAYLRLIWKPRWTYEQDGSTLEWI